MDKQAGTGTVDITVDTSSIDFGNAKLNEHAKTAEMLDVAKYPTATYKGKLAGFKNGAPTEVQGEFTLHGVTKPLTLTINSFKCMTYPMTRRSSAARMPGHLQPRRLRHQLRRQIRLQDGREARHPGRGGPRRPDASFYRIRDTASRASASEAVSPGDSIP